MRQVYVFCVSAPWRACTNYTCTLYTRGRDIHVYYNFILLKRPFRSRSVQPSMVFTAYTKRRILLYHGQGLCAPTIATLLEDEGITVSRRGVAKFILRLKVTGSINRRGGSGRRSKQTAAVKAIVEEAMRADDETTATQLRAILIAKGYSLSLSTLLRCRKSLGWTFRGSAYCQMISVSAAAHAQKKPTAYVPATCVQCTRIVSTSTPRRAYAENIHLAHTTRACACECTLARTKKREREN